MRNMWIILNHELRILKVFWFIDSIWCISPLYSVNLISYSGLKDLVILACYLSFSFSLLSAWWFSFYCLSTIFVTINLSLKFTDTCSFYFKNEISRPSIFPGLFVCLNVLKPALFERGWNVMELVERDQC